MSKFLKVVVNIVIICSILVAAALLIPPFAGVNTVMNDNSSKETNLPTGAVAYGRGVETSKLEKGDKIIYTGSNQAYVYKITDMDSTAGTYKVQDVYNENADETSVQLVNDAVKVVVVVPYIAYAAIALQSKEGLIVVGLGIIFLIILFILAELWRRDSSEDSEEEDEDEAYEDDDYDEDDDDEEEQLSRKERRQLKKEEKRRRKLEKKGLLEDVEEENPEEKESEEKNLKEKDSEEKDSEEKSSEEKGSEEKEPEEKDSEEKDSEEKEPGEKNLEEKAPEEKILEDAAESKGAQQDTGGMPKTAAAVKAEQPDGYEDAMKDAMASIAEGVAKVQDDGQNPYTGETQDIGLQSETAGEDAALSKESEMPAPEAGTADGGRQAEVHAEEAEETAVEVESAMNRETVLPALSATELLSKAEAAGEAPEVLEDKDNDVTLLDYSEIL